MTECASCVSRSELSHGASARSVVTMKKLLPSLIFLSGFIAVGVAGGVVLRGGVTIPLPQLSAPPRTEWTATLDQPYPELTLQDVYGRTIQFSALRGRVVLVEWVGMGCGACQAFSGAGQCGSFGGGYVQPGLQSLDEYSKKYGRFLLSDPRLIVLQVLVADVSGKQPPTAEEGRRWAEHFGLHKRPNTAVLIGDERFGGAVAKRLVPGFHLLDRDLVLRASSENGVGVDLYRELLPRTGKLMAEPVRGEE